MSVTPDFVGQRYKDTTTGDIWIANSTTAGDWSLELQDAKISWSGAAFGEVASLYQEVGLIGITSLTWRATTSTGPIQLSSSSELVTFSAPNLTTLTDSLYDYSYITDNPILESCSLPVFAPTGSLDIKNNPSLTTIDVSGLSGAANNINFNFSNNALSAATVNHILARLVANANYVTGYVDLSGGTNAAPTGQGITDMNTLIARGVSFSTN